MMNMYSYFIKWGFVFASIPIINKRFAGNQKTENNEYKTYFTIATIIN